MYYVIGAEYKTTQFDVSIDGTEEEYGPFEDYQSAYDKWNSRAWSTVDNCLYRFTIEEK